MVHKRITKGIEVKNLNVESVMENIGYGESIVFITDHGELIGAMTEGDINRCFKKGQYVIDTTVVNRKIRYIVESKDLCNVYSMADDVFRKYPKIHNIPVIDDERNFLYQIDRDEDMLAAHIDKCLTVIRQYKPIPTFLECYNCTQIALTGGEIKVLNWVRECIREEIRQCADVSDVEILILENVLDYKKIDSNAVIICLSDTIFRYLRKMSSLSTVSIDEIYQYYFYKELEKIKKETIVNFLKLFGYEKISINAENRYIDRIKSIMEQNNVCVESENDICNSNLREVDICAYSMNGSLKEKMSLENFSITLKRLQEYNYITGRPLTRDLYLREYTACLAKIREEGITGIVFQSYNTLDCEVYDMIKKLEWLHVVKPEDEKDTTIQWMNDYASSSSDSLMINLQYLSIETALVNAGYDFVSRYCNNVYVHRTYWDSRKLADYTRVNRTVENFISNKKFFLENFAEKVIGKNKYSIEQLVSEIKDCAIVHVNEGYMKYQSNYVSEYFNTDIYGCRVTIDVSKRYTGTIWLVGPCIYSGYAVADCDTIASILQNRLNQLDINYRVVNLAMGGSDFWNQVDRISDLKIGMHDIMICWVSSMWNRGNHRVITTDINKFMEQLQDDEYWNYPLHCGVKGYSILAEQILENIKPDLFQLPENKFHLGSTLEKEINIFVQSLMEQLKNSVALYPVMDAKHDKSGAIVMNCNPFTYGHQYLVETASRLVDILYVFVVEEDKSVFPFTERLDMVKKGVKDFKNVVVLPSGKFMISSVTFPGYFTKDNPNGRCYDSFLDLKIFAHYIAPALGVTKRFVGEEPIDCVTAQYNHDMKIILGEQNIDVIEIPRKEINSEVISASKVRQLMEMGKYEILHHYVPESTFDYIQKFLETYVNKTTE